jgi:hypothetical protein
MASPSLRDDFAATVELYSAFIKQLKVENLQLNVSEVSFARGKAGKNSYGNAIPLGFQMFQMFQISMWMTDSSTSMSIMPSPLTRKKTED